MKKTPKHVLMSLNATLKQTNLQNNLNFFECVIYYMKATNDHMLLNMMFV